MGAISDLELPVLENDGNIEKAEACRKELEDVSKSVQCFFFECNGRSSAFSLRRRLELTQF
jgi:hypothetical protein